MNIRFLLTTIFLANVSGCVSDDDQERNLVGSDGDDFGCIGSAGYRWCEKTKKCERPWELAEQEGFENTREDFLEYCGHSSP